MAARGLSPEQRDRLDELAFLLRDDTNVRAVVTRLGFRTVAAAEMLARRGGRPDLAAVLHTYSGHADPYSPGAGVFYERQGMSYQLPTHAAPRKRSHHA